MEIVTEQGHLLITRTYDDDATLRPVSTMTSPKPGWQLNGHRADCRCPTCRPDVHLLCADVTKCHPVEEWPWS